MSFYLQSLHYYPVKSLGEIESDSLRFDEFGPALDRRFMLVDDSDCFVTQRSETSLRFIAVSVSAERLALNHPSFGVLEYHLHEFSDPLEVSVWNDSVSALCLGNSEKDAVLSEYIGKSVRLVFMPDSSFRQVDREYFSADRRVSFADGFPVLLCNTASLLDLNGRLEQPVSMSRFRPNIVVSGQEPFEEDSWRRIRIGEIEFAVVKPCSRCVMTTIDDAGEKGKEPLKTLATYRRNEHGACFGQNLVPLSNGHIRVRDELVVLE